MLRRLFSIRLTKNCAEQIKAIAQPGQGLRLEVEGGEGCGGFTYKFSMDGETEADAVFEEHNAKLIVDRESLDLLDGATVDYTQELIRRSFVVVENPKAEMTCGCGTSFSPSLLKPK